MQDSCHQRHGGGTDRPRCIAKARFGAKDQKILRAEKYVVQDLQPDLATAIKIDVWENKHQIKEGINIFHDLATLKVEWGAGFPTNMDALLAKATTKIKSKMAELIEDLQKVKDKVAEVFDHAEKLRQVLPEFDFAPVMDSVNFLDENEEKLGSAVTG